LVGVKVEHETGLNLGALLRDLLHQQVVFDLKQRVLLFKRDHLGVVAAQVFLGDESRLARLLSSSESTGFCDMALQSRLPKSSNCVSVESMSTDTASWVVRMSARRRGVEPVGNIKSRAKDGRGNDKSERYFCQAMECALGEPPALRDNTVSQAALQARRAQKPKQRKVRYNVLRPSLVPAMRWPMSIATSVMAHGNKRKKSIMLVLK
jgi:hypothetical protein